MNTTLLTRTAYLLFTLVSILLLPTLAQAQPAWQWGKRGGVPHNAMVSNNRDQILYMFTDNNGNVYTIAELSEGLSNIDGRTGISTNDRYALGSWDCQGRFRWKKVFGSYASFGIDGAGIDSLGGIYFTGSFSTDTNFQRTYFDTDTVLGLTNKQWYIAKYDTAGRFQWLKMPQPDTVAKYNPSGGSHMIVHPNGSFEIVCYLTRGHYSNAYAVSNAGFYLLKYNQYGQFQSGLSMPITSRVSTVNGTVDEPGAISLNAKFFWDKATQRYYLVGNYDKTFGVIHIGTQRIYGGSDPVNYKTCYISAFNTQAQHLWTLQGDTSRPHGLGAFQLDEEGNMYFGSGRSDSLNIFGSTFYNPDSLNRRFTTYLSMDSNRQWRWASFGLNSLSYSFYYNKNKVIATSSFGNIYYWGDFGDTVYTKKYPGYSDVHIAHFELNAKTGKRIKAFDTIVSNINHTLATHSTVDRRGQFYIGGQFQKKLYVGKDTLESTGGLEDWFVAKFGSSNCQCTPAMASFMHSANGITQNFTYTGGNATQIVWDMGDKAPVVQGNQRNVAYTYEYDGTYDVCVFITDACGTNSYCRKVTAKGRKANSIESPSNFAVIQVYPSPVSDVLYIDHAPIGSTLRLHNISGQLLHTQTVSEMQMQIPMAHLPIGIYILDIQDQNGFRHTVKVVKE